MRGLPEKRERLSESKGAWGSPLGEGRQFSERDVFSSELNTGWGPKRDETSEKKISRGVFTAPTTETFSCSKGWTFLNSSSQSVVESSSAKLAKGLEFKRLAKFSSVKSEGSTREEREEEEEEEGEEEEEEEEEGAKDAWCSW